MNVRRYKFSNGQGRHKISSETIRRPNEMSRFCLIVEFWQLCAYDSYKALSSGIEETGSGALRITDEGIELGLHIRSDHKGRYYF